MKPQVPLGPQVSGSMPYCFKPCMGGPLIKWDKENPFLIVVRNSTHIAWRTLRTLSCDQTPKVSEYSVHSHFAKNEHAPISLTLNIQYLKRSLQLLKAAD